MPVSLLLGIFGGRLLGMNNSREEDYYLAGRKESKAVRMSRDESALLDNYRTAPPSGKASIERIARLEAGSQGQEAHGSSSEEASA